MAFFRTWIIPAALCATLCVGCDERHVKVKEKPVEVLSERPGVGSTAQDGDLVTIDYKAILPDGRVVQSMRDYRFEVGRGTVISAIEEAVLGMRSGGTRTVSAPPHKHWGRGGYGEGEHRIPENTWLTFEVRLTNVN